MRRPSRLVAVGSPATAVDDAVAFSAGGLSPPTSKVAAGVDTGSVATSAARTRSLTCARPPYRGFEASGFPPSAFDTSAIAFCARTLLPASSSGGETTAIPNLPGETPMMPPPTPLFPGRPV